MSSSRDGRAQQSLALLDAAVLRVERHGDRRSVSDLEVDVRCRGAATVPDAGGVMRTAVYALAAQPEHRQPESLASAIARYCSVRLSPRQVRVEVRVHAWGRVDIGGRERDADLVEENARARFARATIVRGRERIGAGVRALRLLSPGDRDSRALDVVTLHAWWRYGWAEVPYDTQWQQVRRAVTEAYVELDRTHAELPLAIARAVLAQSPAVAAIGVRLERTARRAVDMTAYGLDERGDIHGESAGGRLIESAMLRRDELPA